MPELSVVMGVNEVPYLGDGWMERESSPDGPAYRACGQRAELRLPPGGAMEVSVLLRALAAGHETPVRGKLIVDDNRTRSFELRSPHWSVRTMEIPASEDSRSLFLEAEQIWRPSDLFGNNDNRAIGFLVASIHGDPAPEPAQNSGDEWRIAMNALQ